MYFFYVYYRKNRVIIANGKKFRKRWFTRTAKLYKVFVGKNINNDFFNATTYYSNHTHRRKHDRILRKRYFFLNLKLTNLVNQFSPRLLHRAKYIFHATLVVLFFPFDCE